MTDRASVEIVPEPVGLVSPWLFGALTEHIGTSIYGGIWDPERDRPRLDAMLAARAMGVSMLRYPGGCFSSWYHWRDGVGPKDRRPFHSQQYWTSVDPGLGPPEPNRFGTDEFLRYCLDIDAEPLLVADAGGGTPDEAADWVRYCNVDRRSARPVTWWAIGNEPWGTGELGHSGPGEYGALFAEFAAAMRAVDPAIKLVGVGGPGLAGEGDVPSSVWNPAVLDAAGRQMDALSVHWYFPGLIGRPLGENDADYLQLVSGPDVLEAVVERTIGDIAERLGDRTLPVAVDEWNRMVEFDDHFSCNHRLVDALFFGGGYNVFLRHADQVVMAMIAQLVNCLGPIQTSTAGCFVTAAHLVAALYARFGTGTSVRVAIESPETDVPPLDDVRRSRWSPHPAVRAGRRMQMIDAAATRDGDRTSVFLLNRERRAVVPVVVRGLPGGGSGRFRYVGGPGPFAANSVGDPLVLGYREVPLEVGAAGSVTIEVPAHTVGVAVVR